MKTATSIKSLRSLIGQTLIARIPAINPDDMTLVRLHAVEPAGVWVESQDFIEAVTRRCRLATSPTTLLMFIPYSGIQFVLAGIDAVWLSEEALGLREDDD